MTASISQKRDLLIFLHGFPDTADVWRDYVKIAGADYVCWAPSLPGTDGEQEYNTDLGSFVLQILTKIKKFDPKRTFIVGHDVGAPLAVMLAEHLKGQLSGLVLINGMSIKQFSRRLKNPRQLRRSWYMFVMQPKFLPETILAIFGKALLKIPRAYKQENYRPDEKGMRGFWIYRALLKEARFAVNQRGLIETPTLVLWGNRDPFLLSPQKDEFEKQFSNFEIRIFEGDHWFHLANPASIYKIMDTFFQGKK